MWGLGVHFTFHGSETGCSVGHIEIELRASDSPQHILEVHEAHK